MGEIDIIAQLDAQAEVIGDMLESRVNEIDTHAKNVKSGASEVVITSMMDSDPVSAEGAKQTGAVVKACSLAGPPHANSGDDEITALLKAAQAESERSLRTIQAVQATLEKSAADVATDAVPLPPWQVAGAEGASESTAGELSKVDLDALKAEVAAQLQSLCKAGMPDAPPFLQTQLTAMKKAPPPPPPVVFAKAKATFKIPAFAGGKILPPGGASKIAPGKIPADATLAPPPQKREAPTTTKIDSKAKEAEEYFRPADSAAKKAKIEVIDHFTDEVLEKVPTTLQTCRSLLQFVDKKLENAPASPAVEAPGIGDLLPRIVAHADLSGRLAGFRNATWDARAKRVLDIGAIAKDPKAVELMSCLEEKLDCCAKEIQTSMKERGEDATFEALSAARRKHAEETVRRDWFSWCARLLRAQETKLLSEETAKTASAGVVGQTKVGGICILKGILGIDAFESAVAAATV